LERWKKRRLLTIKPAKQFSDLTLHGDHLLAHVEHDFDALQIQSHLFHEQARDAHAVNLIERIELAVFAGERADYTLALKTPDKLLIDAAELNHFGDSKVLACHTYFAAI
jgi:hypothetical protein